MKKCEWGMIVTVDSTWSIGAGAKIFVFKDPKPLREKINISVNRGPGIICLCLKAFFSTYQQPWLVLFDKTIVHISFI